MLSPVRTLSFLAGLVFGTFALLIAQNLGFLRLTQRPPPPAEIAIARGADGRPDASSLTPEQRAAQDEMVERLGKQLGDPQGKSLDALAVALEEALFEQDWAKVQAVAALIRSKSAEWVAPPVAPTAVAEEKSLYDQERELKRKRDEERFARRRNAATALAGKSDPGSIEQLQRIFDGSEGDERRDAALLLLRSGDQAGLRGILAALRSASPGQRAAAGGALARESSLAGMNEALSILSSEADAGLRASAVQCLALYDAAQRGEPQNAATRACIEALRHDRSEEVRAAAAKLFTGADLENGRVIVDALLEVMAGDDSAAVRLAAASALWGNAREFGPASGVADAVARALMSEQDAPVRRAMLAYLRDNGDPSAIVKLEEFAALPAARADPQALEEAREALRARLPTGAVR
jgi:hypothetical protein